MSSIPIASFAIDSDLMKRIWSEVSPSHCFCALVKTSPSLSKVVLNTYDRFCLGFSVKKACIYTLKLSNSVFELFYSEYNCYFRGKNDPDQFS